jgi:hypothetical protein
MMTAGSKKGYRYLLPFFLLYDAALAGALGSLLVSAWNEHKRKMLAGALLVLLAWQAAGVLRLHPYNLAYINPLTKRLFGERRIGWGEGLDIAAVYLNQKPDAESLTVAGPLPSELTHVFIGNSVSLNRWDHEDVDYALLYPSLFEREKGSWERDVVENLQKLEPEHIIRLGGKEYVWIYDMR